MCFCSWKPGVISSFMEVGLVLDFETVGCVKRHCMGSEEPAFWATPTAKRLKPEEPWWFLLK